MFKSEDLVKQINKRCGKYFLESNFLLDQIAHNKIIAKRKEDGILRKQKVKR